MNNLKTLFAALIGAFFVIPAFASTQASEDSARYYRSFPDKFDGKKVSVDCAFVTRVNGRRQVDGVVFFVAHTADKENKTFGGVIVVAVLEGDEKSFLRKFGNTVDRNPGQTERIETTTLRGTFHQLKTGHVYIDYSGEAHEILLNHREAAMENVQLSEAEEAGLPGSGPGKRRGPQ